VRIRREPVTVTGEPWTRSTEAVALGRSPAARIRSQETCLSGPRTGFEAEMEVHMKRLTSATLTAIVVLSLASITPSAQNRLPSNARRALQWLQCTQQQLNGQIGSGRNPTARSWACAPRTRRLARTP